MSEWSGAENLKARPNPCPIDEPKLDMSDPQLRVLLEAYAIYLQRQSEHGDKVWKASGWRGMLVDMRKKLDRAWFKFWDRDAGVPLVTDDASLDSAIDLINFTAFFIRQVRAGDRDGSWPWENNA